MLNRRAHDDDGKYTKKYYLKTGNEEHITTRDQGQTIKVFQSYREVSPCQRMCRRECNKGENTTREITQEGREHNKGDSMLHVEGPHQEMD